MTRKIFHVTAQMLIALGVLQSAAEKSGEKIVIHCAGGSGRTSLGCGLWLAKKYGLSAEDACRWEGQRTLQ